MPGSVTGDGPTWNLQVYSGVALNPEVDYPRCPYYCWWYRNPKQPPFGCKKSPENNGDIYHFSTGAGFFSIDSMTIDRMMKSSHLKFIFFQEEGQHWKCLGPLDVGLNDFLFSPQTLRQEIVVDLRIQYLFEMGSNYPPTFISRIIQCFSP